MPQQAFIVKIEIDDSIDKQAVIEDITENLLADGYQVIDVASWKTQDEAVSMAANLFGSGVDPDDAGMGLPGIGGLGI